MGYRCGNCNVDFPTKRAIVTHMLMVHNCGYEAGDPELIEITNEIKESPKFKTLNEIVRGEN